MPELNPFSDEYWKQELESYGPVEPRKNGNVEIRYEVPRSGPCNDYFNKNYRKFSAPIPAAFIDGKVWMSRDRIVVEVAPHHDRYKPIRISDLQFYPRHALIYELGERVS